jgi:BASS family bile acid:Na+ symporter
VVLIFGVAAEEIDMHLLQVLLPLLIQGSLAALVLAVGLDATLDDVLYLIRRPALLARAFLAISIIVPVVAVLVIRALPISLPSKVGVILMALAPVPPFVPGKDLKLGGHKSYVYGLYVAFAVLAVIIVPATVAVLNHLYGASADVPMGKLAGTVVFSVLLPLVVGMLLHARWPAATSAAAVWVGRLAVILVAIVVIPLLVKAWPAMLAMTGDGTVLAIALIVAAGAAAGHMLGGPDLADRAALANSAATRHPGIALMIATSIGADKRVTAIVLLFVIVALVIMTIYQQVLKRLAHPKPGAAAPVAR